MNVLVLFCHPEPKSFNAALKNETQKHFEARGAKVEVSDLYAQGFDPVEKAEHYNLRTNTQTFEPLSEQRNAWKTDTVPVDVQHEIEKLNRCDLLILQFPLWWHQQPAMLKGWFDRVFLAGGLYTSTMRYDRGYFKGKRAVCSVTSGAPRNNFTKRGRAGGDIESLLHSLNFSLHYMGFEVLPPRLIAEVQGAGFTYKEPDEFEAGILCELDSWRKYLEEIDNVNPMCFAGWHAWDERGVEIVKK